MRLAAFDLDGTLLKEETVCETIASGIGHIERMREFEQLRYNQIGEIAAAREEMATWYSPYKLEVLCGYLTKIRIAPGTESGFALLRNHGFKIAIESLTWQFAVKWFADRLGADYCIGVRLLTDGQIAHFWSEDKALWVRKLAEKLGVEMCDVAAVGDSGGDIPMLLASGHSIWVGETVPHELIGRVAHHPDGDINKIAQGIVRNRRRTL